MTCILNGLQVNAYLTRWFVSFAELSCLDLETGAQTVPNRYQLATLLLLLLLLFLLLVLRLFHFTTDRH